MEILWFFLGALAAAAVIVPVKRRHLIETVDGYTFVISERNGELAISADVPFYVEWDSPQACELRPLPPVG